ncbi:unnamed protein product [Symbiodinium sp. CCMP2456]|nr:unnamed protein product [Symbiodinium sp. CCMP2456]
MLVSFTFLFSRYYCLSCYEKYETITLLKMADAEFPVKPAIAREFKYQCGLSMNLVQRIVDEDVMHLPVMGEPKVDAKKCEVTYEEVKAICNELPVGALEPTIPVEIPASRTITCTTQECCGSAEQPPNPSCFDPVYTEELCCMEADWDIECWQHARVHLSEARRIADGQATAGTAGWAMQMEALQRYMVDDMLLYLFCCNGFHNEYCWGPAVPQALLPDPDAWEGVSDIVAWYPRCCFPRLRGMLKAGHW